MNYRYLVIIILLMSFLLSCNNNDNKKKAVFYGSDYTSEFQTESSSTKPRPVGDYLDI